MVKLVNNGDKVVRLNKGNRFVQGIIQKYYVNDVIESKRNGGIIGSSGK